MYVNKRKYEEGIKTAKELTIKAPLFACIRVDGTSIENLKHMKEKFNFF